MFPNKKRGKNMEPKIVGKKVQELIEKSNINKEELAKKLDMSEEELNKKLKGEVEFYVSEVILITEIFDLDIKTVSKIFFSQGANETDETNEANETDEAEEGEKAEENQNNQKEMKI